MTALTEFFCDFCNPSRQRRDEGDEVRTGYDRVAATITPPGRWFELRNGGHGCGSCVASEEFLKRAVFNERYDLGDEPPEPTPGGVQHSVHPPPPAPADTDGIHDERSGGWPSRTAPFGGQGG